MRSALRPRFERIDKCTRGAHCQAGRCRHWSCSEDSRDGQCYSRLSGSSTGHIRPR
ncbi:hypothetical protein KI387_024400, partial [Taxus chinensis]